MRAFIRARIAAGETKHEIESQLVGEFGEAALAAPPAHGFGLLAWLLPILGLLGAGAVVGLVARQWTPESSCDLPLPSNNGSLQLDPALEHAVDDELARYEA